MNVIVTNDGSARSLQAVPHAAAFARAAGADLTILRVLDPNRDCGHAAERLDEEIVRTSAAWTTDLAAALRRVGASGTPLVVVRAPDEDTTGAIVRVAAERGASLLAMATRGAGAVHHLLFGSIAMGIVGTTRLPVMVTGPSIEPPTEARYRLVATTDGSDASLAVVRALQPALDSPAIDTLLLSLSWPGEGDDRDQKCHAALARLRAEIPAAHRIDEIVREAPLIEGLADMIITVSAEYGASAIAMATHGHGAAYHLLAGSVALGVVSRSPQPVILARSK